MQNPKGRKGLFIEDWGKGFQIEKNINGMKAGVKMERWSVGRRERELEAEVLFPDSGVMLRVWMLF